MKKKKEKAPASQKIPEIKKTELEEICGNDKQVYEALKDTMFLDPRKIEISMKEAAANAEKFEKSGDRETARKWYETAGKLAIWEGDVKKVVEFFSKCQGLSNRTYPILEIPEKAVSKAQEYYQKCLEEKKEEK